MELARKQGMVIAANLGFPRIGPNRELKLAPEWYWSSDSTAGDLLAAARVIRKGNWAVQAGSGLDHVPCNDFSLYDHSLDMAVPDISRKRSPPSSSGRRPRPQLHERAHR